MSTLACQSGALRHVQTVRDFEALCAGPLRALFDVGAISARADHPGYNRLVKLSLATRNDGLRTVFAIDPKLRAWRGRQDARPTRHLITEIANWVADKEVFGR